jgi:hypothetical protein
MPSGWKPLNALLLGAALMVVPAITGCASHAEYRVYDSGYGDYHVWNHGETVYYQNWEHETHRSHVDFRSRPPTEQNEYWKWRHEHH